MIVERRRLLLMRHGAVEYFDADGRPLRNEQVPLTNHGIEQARAMGRALAAAGVTIDRALCTGLPRTQATAEHVLSAFASVPPLEVVSDLTELRPGRLADIPADRIREAFIAPFEGEVSLETAFLGGETIGQLLARVLPALQALLDASDWDTALVVAHGGVNRALLSWFLTGQPSFLGGLAQDPGCLNIVDVGDRPASSIVRVVNFCPLEPLQTSTRQSTMERLLQQYLRGRPPQVTAAGSE